jgi:P27 family predicted phage terminase small subunit
MRGRKPTPTALKVLRGNPGKRPINKQEPKPAPKVPDMPMWLSAEGKAEWRRVVPELDGIGMLTKVDRAALAAYCAAWARLVEAERLIAKFGHIVFVDPVEIGSDGDMPVFEVRPASNPALREARAASQLVRQFCAEFGLTPSARTRISLPEPDEDQLSDLLG